MSNVFSVKTQLELYRLFSQEVVERLIQLSETKKRLVKVLSTSMSLYHKRLQFCKKWICPLIRWPHTQWSKPARNNSENKRFQSHRNWTLLTLKPAQAPVYYSDFYHNSYRCSKVDRLSADLGVTDPFLPDSSNYYNQACEYVVWRWETLRNNPQVISQLTLTLSLF